MPDISRLPKPLVAHWEWQIQAACRGMDDSVFFHPPDERDPDRSRRIENAKAICESCPAITECRAYALGVREPYGIWGGLSEHDRASLLGVRSMRLLSNNPRKLVGIEGYGLSVSEWLPLEIPAQDSTRRYLKTKKEKMGHKLSSV